MFSTCRQRRLRGGVQTQVQKEPERILLHPVSKAQVYRLLDAKELYWMNAVYLILIITYPVLWLYRLRIMIRGKKVKTKLISKSLSSTESDSYKPRWLDASVPVGNDDSFPFSTGFSTKRKQKTTLSRSRSFSAPCRSSSVSALRGTSTG